MTVSDETPLWMHEAMLVIRRYEEKMVRVCMEGKLAPHVRQGLALDIGSGSVPGKMHLTAGQEPVAAAVCAHLRGGDTVVGTHRPRHFAIAKKVPLDAITADSFGKATGLSRGKDGHMHLFDSTHRFSCSASTPETTSSSCW
jgi:TPP-dependent pyruvate/acetoin dehydrogenase alpha subunit